MAYTRCGVVFALLVMQLACSSQAPAQLQYTTSRHGYIYILNIYIIDGAYTTCAWNCGVHAQLKFPHRARLSDPSHLGLLDILHLLAWLLGR